VLVFLVPHKHFQIVGMIPPGVSLLQSTHNMRSQAVVHHHSSSPFECDEGSPYVQEVPCACLLTKKQRCSCFCTHTIGNQIKLIDTSLLLNSRSNSFGRGTQRQILGLNRVHFLRSSSSGGAPPFCTASFTNRLLSQRPSTMSAFGLVKKNMDRATEP
jgi:hypothetical protein